MIFGEITHATLPDGSVVPAIRGEQMPTLMVIYSGGYLAIFLIFGLLYFHAYRRGKR